MIEVELLRAWPRRFESCSLRLDVGATVEQAVAAAGWTGGDQVAYAVHGVRVSPQSALRDGDRVELLRPLVADPKEARRRRAAGR
ncbi:RnfH family protein [Lysobacter humi (ex Lee et al. 2017)]